MEIHGNIDARFASVRDAFESNFEEGEEVGAALCVYLDGEPVVDIWAGVADVDEDVDWAQNTLSVMDSATKAVTGICALMLVDEGALKLDEPVSTYWPEFGQAGKEAITVRTVMSHQAGLPAIDHWITLDDVDAWDPIIHALERQAPLWEPGTAHGYHGLTIGWLVGELIRRITGLHPGAFLRERIVPQLELDMWIGNFPEQLESRVAKTIRVDFDLASLATTTGDADYDAMAEEVTRLYMDPSFIEMYYDPSKRAGLDLSKLTLTQRAFGPVDVGHDMNGRRHHNQEIPAASGISDARSIARLYASLVGDGVGGVRLIGDDVLSEATRVHARGKDQIVKAETVWGLVFSLPGGPLFPAHGSGREFGHAGANGTLGYADPGRNVSFGYIRNAMSRNVPDPRFNPLLDAVYNCL